MGKNWKLNDSLIQDPEVINRIEQELEAFIRGLLIGTGVGQKKEREKKMALLYREIQEIEQRTRPKGIPERPELTVKKEELLERERKCAFHTVNKEIYQWGNKSGKWLARRLKEKKTTGPLFLK